MLRCARRELFEETGYKAAATALLPLGEPYYASPGFSTERIVLYAVEVHGEPRTTPPTDGSVMEEQNETFAVSLAEALSWCDTGIIRNAVTELAIRRLAARIAGRSGVAESVAERRLSAVVRELTRMRRENSYYHRLIREFQARVTHELRHPAASIAGWIALLKKKNVTDEIRDKALTVIADDVRRMAEVSGNLIRVALGDTSEAFENSVFSPAEEIALAVNEIGFLFDPSRVRVDITVADGIRRLIGSRERFRIIVENLLSNALKFTPRGTVRVTVSDHATPGEGKIDFSPDLFNYHVMKDIRPYEIEIVVADSGIGIDRRLLKKVFQPFFQGDSGFDRAFGGLGLGLTVVRHLVESMQGHIEIESRRGVGTEVRVYLPFGKSD
jgi:signal transduction histidine kinase